MSAAIVFSRRESDNEVRIILHPISLALVLAELVEDAARKRCRRKGHVETPVPNHRNPHCDRCGTSLPDDGPEITSWFPEAYRAVRGKQRAKR